MTSLSNQTLPRPTFILEIPQLLQTLIDHHSSITLTQLIGLRTLSQRRVLWGSIDFYTPEYWVPLQFPMKETRLKSIPFKERNYTDADRMLFAKLTKEIGEGGAALKACSAIMGLVSVTVNLLGMSSSYWKGS